MYILAATISTLSVIALITALIMLKINNRHSPEIKRAVPIIAVVFVVSAIASLGPRPADTEASPAMLMRPPARAPVVGRFQNYVPIQDESEAIELDPTTEIHAEEPPVDAVAGGGAITQAHSHDIGCNHDFDGHIEVDATCNQLSVVSLTCKVCGFKDKEPPVLMDHVGTETVIRKPTLTENGETQIICDMCGEIFIAPIPHQNHPDIPQDCHHDFSVAINQFTRCELGHVSLTCRLCGFVYTGYYIPPVDHTGTETIIREATQTKDGEKTIHCDMCGESFTVVIPRTCSHDFSVEVIEPLSCTGGRNRLTCKLCGIIYEEDFSPSDHEGTETIIREATQTRDGEKTIHCDMCGKTFTVTIPRTCTHDFKSHIEVPPTCSTDGLVRLTCKLCGFSETDYPPLIDHVGTETITRAPTQTTEGEKALHCNMCGETFITAILKLG